MDGAVGVKQKEEKGNEEKKPGKFARMKEVLAEGLRKAGKGTFVLLTAGAIAISCGDAAKNDDGGIVIPDGQTDGQVDGQTDGGDQVDGDQLDGDQEDGGVVDGADEVQPLCEGVQNESLMEAVFPRNEPVNVGGYSITYVDYTRTTVVVDIKCATTGEEVATGVSMTGLVENFVEVPEDGKKIIVMPLMKNGWRMSANVWVEDL